MADRFDKFTERARRALSHAQEESRRFNHDYIGTEHLLLGLIQEEDGAGVVVITNLGVRLSDLQSAVASQIGRGEGVPAERVDLTSQGKKAIEQAVAEARRLKHSHIGTEHLLLGLIRQGEGVAFDVLESLGITLEKARAETERVLAEGGLSGRRRPAVREAWAAIQEAIAAIEAVDPTDMASDLSRGLLLPLLRLIEADFRALTVSNLPVSYDLEVRRRTETNLLLLDEAAAVFERHGIAHEASLLERAATSVRAVAG
jgi:hypothetical protein